MSLSAYDPTPHCRQLPVQVNQVLSTDLSPPFSIDSGSGVVVSE